MTGVLQYFETLDKMFILAKDDERSDSNLRGNYYLPLIYIRSYCNSIVKFST